MTTLVSRAVFVLVLAGSLSAKLASAQPFYDQLDSWNGPPCSFGPFTSQSSGGSVGCWGVGTCYNGQYYPDVSWYQHWSCSNGNFVTASGSSYVEYQLGTWNGVDYISYPYGLMASGQATVYVGSGHTDYSGWDEQDCDGLVDYSGPYNYVC